MELHRLRASQVSVAQPLQIIYHWYLAMSNSIFASGINSLCVSMCDILVLVIYGIQPFFYMPVFSQACAIWHIDYSYIRIQISDSHSRKHSLLPHTAHTAAAGFLHYVFRNCCWQWHIPFQKSSVRMLIFPEVWQFLLFCIIHLSVIPSLYTAIRVHQKLTFCKKSDFFKNTSAKPPPKLL